MCSFSCMPPPPACSLSSVHLGASPAAVQAMLTCAVGFQLSPVWDIAVQGASALLLAWTAPQGGRGGAPAGRWRRHAMDASASRAPTPPSLFPTPCPLPAACQHYTAVPSNAQFADRLFWGMRHAVSLLWSFVAPGAGMALAGAEAGLAPAQRCTAVACTLQVR